MNEEQIKKFISAMDNLYLAAYDALHTLQNIKCDEPEWQQGTIDLLQQSLQEIRDNQFLPRFKDEKEPTEFDKKMKECHQYGLCVSHPEDLDEQPLCVTCDICPRKNK